MAQPLGSKSGDISPRPTSESGTSSMVKDNLGFMRFFSMARKNEPRASFIIEDALKQHQFNDFESS